MKFYREEMLQVLSLHELLFYYEQMRALVKRRPGVLVYGHALMAMDDLVVFARETHGVRLVQDPATGEVDLEW